MQHRPHHAQAKTNNETTPYFGPSTQSNHTQRNTGMRRASCAAARSLFQHDTPK